ncbi:MAG: hypothetical protein KME08_03745 [Aphanothece sp. CMT-3BRIN-NPC111]|jgi:hypothetical protein|nr:hypothetical protein [Aphanothece sp. CMT-3BRIN-NPC111]
MQRLYYAPVSKVKAYDAGVTAFQLRPNGKVKTSEEQKSICLSAPTSLWLIKLTS